MSIRQESFSRARLTDLLAFVSSNAARRMPDLTYLMPGDICWRLPGSAPKDNLALFYDEVGLAGYVWFEPGTDIEIDLRWNLDYGHPVTAVMLDWAEAARRKLAPAYPRFVDLDSMDAWAREILAPERNDDCSDRWLTAIAFESDEERIRFLTDAGFEATRHFAPYYRLDLAGEIPASGLEEHMKLRAVTEDDIDDRVELHRAAWLGSGFDRARYEQIRAMPEYQSALDIVLETADGFASYCICWENREASLGSFEPVGTSPAWRGKGIGRAVILEGLRRLKARGMRYAQVGTAGFNTPAQALYESCGFARVDTARTYMKIVP
ncbi:MAG: GNAT family N-acetyltransferase [Pseudomonadales bacterium]